VEQQTATTNEMGRNIVEAATGSSQVAQSVSGVATSAQVTERCGRGAADRGEPAGDLP
jgi:methyl-accepting chemotaxis protein